MLRKIALILILFFILPVWAKAESWKQVKGTFARVEYQTPYEPLARHLLAIADGEIPRLAKLHGLSEKQIKHLPQARIILTDKPDISNGYALKNSVVIYALSSMYMPFWSEQKTWYRLVLTHELAHWVSFKVLRRKLSILGDAMNLTVPRWFFEGVAQYFAESWNTFRGDFFLKQALLYGNLNFSALQNLSNGRLLYASGNAFIRYLAAEYGDSALIRLLNYKPHGWYYDFDKAFKSTFGKKPKEIFPDFVRHSILYYGNFLANLPLAHFPEVLPVLAERTTQFFVLSTKDSTFLVAGKEKDIYNFYSLFIVRKKNGHVKILKRLTNHLATEAILSPDKRFIAYGIPYYSTQANQTALNFRWLIYDRNTDKEIKLGHLFRSRYGAFDYRNHFYLAEIQADRSLIHRFSENFTQEDTLYNGRKTVGYFTFTPQNLLIAEIQNSNGRRRLCVWRKETFSHLKIDSEDQRSPVCLNTHYLIFNELIKNMPVVSVYDLKKDSVVSSWVDQYGYWLSGADSGQAGIIASRYESDGQAHFYRIPFDSILHFSAKPQLPKANFYGSWQNKPPLLPDTLHFSNKKATPGKPSTPVLLPYFPMEHLLSFVLPFYDKDQGYGLYGCTLWMEALQRQVLAAGFWLTPQQMDHSIFLINHALKAFNTDINTYVYYGPVILSHPEGLRQQVNFSLGRQVFINGSNRWKLGSTLAYGYFYQHFKNKSLYPMKRVWFNGPSIKISLKYNLSTAISSAIPKRIFTINAFYFKTFWNSNYMFKLFETNLMAGSNLISENFGLVERFSFIRQQGHLLPFQIVGIDRYYEFDMPREYLFTRTIRGLRENIDSGRLIWNSTELRYFIKRFTPYKLIFLPIQNVTVDAFADFARLGVKIKKDVASTGMQISFGDKWMRFSVGYARTFKQGQFHNETYFVRMAVLLNGDTF